MIDQSLFLFSPFVSRAIQNSFPVFSASSNQADKLNLDFRPIGPRPSVCRILKPNITCRPSDLDEGFIDIDFAVSIFYVNLTHNFYVWGLTEPLEDVLTFPVVSEGEREKREREKKDKEPGNQRTNSIDSTFSLFYVGCGQLYPRHQPRASGSCHQRRCSARRQRPSRYHCGEYHQLEGSAHHRVARDGGEWGDRKADAGCRHYGEGWMRRIVIGLS